MKKAVSTFVEWDFARLKNDPVLGTFYGGAERYDLIVEGFRIRSGRTRRVQRCRHLEVDLWVNNGDLKLPPHELFKDTLARHGIIDDVTNHSFLSAEWLLKKDESVVDGAIRVARILEEKLDLRTNGDQWVKKGLISWFSVLQHTEIIDGETRMSEEDYLRKKHGLPPLNATLSPNLVVAHMREVSRHLINRN